MTFKKAASTMAALALLSSSVFAVLCWISPPSRIFPSKPSPIHTATKDGGEMFYPQTQTTATKWETINVTDEKADPPEFKRTYTAQLTREVSIKVEMSSATGLERYDSSELDQRDGKWVLFDLKEPADKILDRELLPIVERYCRMIRELDAAYMKSDPDTFIDSKGQVWKREAKR